MAPDAHCKHVCCLLLGLITFTYKRNLYSVSNYKHSIIVNVLKVLSRVNPTSCFDWLVVLCVQMVQVLIYLFQRSPYSFCPRTPRNEKESKTIRLLCMRFPNAKCHRLPPGSRTNQRSPRVGVVVVVMTIFSFISFGYFFSFKMVNCCVYGCGSRNQSESDSKLSFFRIPLDKRKRLAWLSELRNELLGCNHRVCSKHFVSGSY